MEILEEIKEMLIKGNAPKVKELVQKAIASSIPVADILNQGLIAGMSIIGGLFKNQKIYLPEVLIAARAMDAGMKILEPLLVKAGVSPIGKIVIGTVKGDLHDIGKNLVMMMLKGAGFEVFDLGIDVSAEKFIASAKSQNAQIIGISALLTTTMVNMKQIIELLKQDDLTGKIKTLIGGAPVTQEFADEIGADGFASDASTAVDKAKELINK